MKGLIFIKLFNKKNIYQILIFTFIFIFTFTSISFGAHPQLIIKLNSAFEKIKSWLVSLATPAAAVAIASGIFMKKFSFGDDERMRIGKKLIRTAIFSYALILVLDLVLATIQNLLSN